MVNAPGAFNPPQLFGTSGQPLIPVGRRLPLELPAITTGVPGAYHRGFWPAERPSGNRPGGVYHCDSPQSGQPRVPVVIAPGAITTGTPPSYLGRPAMSSWQASGLPRFPVVIAPGAITTGTRSSDSNILGHLASRGSQW